MVRGLPFLLELVTVLALAYLAYRGISALGGRRAPVVGLPVVGLPVGGRWQTHHYAYAGHTVVSVARLTPAGEVVEEQGLPGTPDPAAAWSGIFRAAREVAVARAFHLNAE